MKTGGFVSWDDWKPILHSMTCPCCMGVTLMPTGEELEERINEQIDQERIQDAILNLEIETLRKAVDNVENVSGLPKGTAGKQTD